MFASTINGVLKLHETDVPDLEQLQEAVGGWIETAGVMPSPDREHVELIAYCNEEGLLMDLPVMFRHRQTRQPIAGDLVFTAVDSRTGDTIAATKEELEEIAGMFSLLTF